MWRAPLCFFIFGLIPVLRCADETDYYWREYTGTIPEDALVGGKNINGENIYIGQAYIHEDGLMVVQINAGIKEVAAPIKGVKKVSTNIKILCGLQENFSWLPTTARNLHMDLLNKKAVIGGHEDGFGSINIGRISYEGGAQIGKINAFEVGNAGFAWADIYDKEAKAESYEVLIFDKSKSSLL